SVTEEIFSNGRKFSPEASAKGIILQFLRNNPEGKICKKYVVESIVEKNKEQKTVNEKLSHVNVEKYFSMVSRISSIEYFDVIDLNQKLNEENDGCQSIMCHFIEAKQGKR